MTKLKLTSLLDDKPVKLSIDLPASIYRDLVAYGELLAKTTGAAGPIEPIKLIAPGTLYHDRPGLCESAAVGVINLPVS